MGSGTVDSLRSGALTNSIDNVTCDECVCSCLGGALACQRPGCGYAGLRIASGGASFVPMVQSTNFRERHHATFRRRLDASWRGRVLLERQMGSCPMIIGEIARPARAADGARRER